MSIKAGQVGFNYSDITKPLTKALKGPLPPIEQTFPDSAQFRIGHYVILEEFDDYLVCKGFDPNSQYPFSHHTPGIRKTIKVAKPSLLMRTPWDGTTVNLRVDGVLTDVTYAYDDTELGKRTATWDGGEETQRIEVPYFPGDAIMAVEVARSSGYDGLKRSTVASEAGGRLTWMDVNNSGRRWKPDTEDVSAHVGKASGTITAFADPTIGTGSMVVWSLDALTTLTVTTETITVYNMSSESIADGTWIQVKKVQDLWFIDWEECP